MLLAFGPKNNDLYPMNKMPAKLKARAERKSAKREEKKRQIAQSTIKALKELGYANTSLRDIAEKSDLSLGMLHYYFEDRAELIIYCVRVYKHEFVRNIIAALKGLEGSESVLDGFSKALTRSVVQDSMTHKLWYDIRTQAMFDETFRAVVAEIEHMLIGIVRDAVSKAGKPTNNSLYIQYAAIDGLFRYLIQHQTGETPRSEDEIAAIFRSLLAQYL